ncbi:MAG: response regulator transcription factor [Planctomycetota bacterium]
MTRILVAEDDPTLRMGLEDALRGEGHEVLVAADGARAEELLYSRHFDLVVLDLMMPLKGGLEVLRDFRARGLMTPVLVLTARSSENDKVLGLELGADDYVTKPFGLRELLARIRVLLRREAPRVVSRERFLEEIWRGGEHVTNRTVDTHVLNLRRKIERDPKRPRHLLTVHGAGYRLAPEGA